MVQHQVVAQAWAGSSPRKLHTGSQRENRERNLRNSSHCSVTCYFERTPPPLSECATMATRVVGIVMLSLIVGQPAPATGLPSATPTPAPLSVYACPMNWSSAAVVATAAGEAEMSARKCEFVHFAGVSASFHHHAITTPILTQCVLNRAACAAQNGLCRLLSWP